MSALPHFLVPALWLCWLCYWGIASRGVKQTQREESRRSGLSHHLPLIAGAVLIAWPHILGAAMDGDFVARTAAWRWFGTALLAAGLGIAVLARVWLGGNWSSTVTLKQDHELIRNGPYAFVRHPIYSGLLLALAGTVIFVGEWRTLIGFALVVVGLVRKLTIEERFMADEFGEDYARYRHQVAALIPFVI